MDDLDRVYQRLVHSIRQRHPEYLTVPFTVQELYEDLIPYRHHRRELGIETNQDYESAITRLLSGERGYIRGDAKMAERLAAEVSSATGDTGAFREFASSRITLDPVPLKQLGVDSPSPAPAPLATTGAVPPDAVAAPPANVPPLPDVQQLTPVPKTTGALAGTLLQGGDDCRFCGGHLPDGRPVTYCPHCGQNLSVKNCPACGTELEAGWKFCVTCGRTVG